MALLSASKAARTQQRLADINRIVGPPVASLEPCREPEAAFQPIKTLVQTFMPLRSQARSVGNMNRTGRGCRIRIGSKRYCS